MDPTVPVAYGYLGAAFAEALQGDGLLVLGRGLGLPILVARFLRLYCVEGRRLVFCLNMCEEEVRTPNLAIAS